MRADTMFAYGAHLEHSVDYPSYIPPDGCGRRVRNINPESKAGITICRLIESGRLPSLCPYCRSPLECEEGLFRGPNCGPTYDRGGREKSGQVGARCLTCNWWCIVKNYHEAPAYDDDDDYFYYDYHYGFEGIIARFSSKVWQDIMPKLAGELSEFRKGLASLSPGEETERFVGQLLSQYMNCDVLHVGRSGDKGVDLIVIGSDVNAAVQVKHRSINRRRRAEGVEQVREFVGAMVTEEFKSGIFVTTAEDFSRGAEEVADKCSRQYAPINLVTARRLQEFLGLVVVDQWREYKRLWRWESVGNV